ncbi:MAG: Alpha-xylosidase, partial [Verrucomicrobiota bacterium]
LTKFCPLDQIPIFVRAGALLVLAPEMQFTGEKPWSPLTLDCYPHSGASDTATLYEDDGRTIAHTRGEFRKTEITASTDAATHTLKISIAAARGSFPGALAAREWILRFRRPAGWPEKLLPGEIKLNGARVENLVRLARQPATMPFGDPSGAPDGAVFEAKLPARAVNQSSAVEIHFR